ncbi:thymidylate synthase [Thalassospira xiamenensis]|nr:thymidylate synthase [Thalassospira xiamenensis]
MNFYKSLVRDVLDMGQPKKDRTSVGTISLFGYQYQHDLRTGFPLLTTKKVHFRSVVEELLWFLTGSTNIRPLLLNKTTIWSEWPHKKYVEKTGCDISLKDFERQIVEDMGFANAHGDLGPVYGKQWRRWSGNTGQEIDQLSDVIHQLRHSPTSRRIIMTGWNPSDLPNQLLPPCHTLYQWGSDGKFLDVHLYQRSADVGLGLPFNLASVALLTSMIALVTNLEPRRVIHSFGDLHIYENHRSALEEQILREPQPLPRLHLSSHVTEIDGFTREDIELEGYNPAPSIKMNVAV